MSLIETLAFGDTTSESMEGSQIEYEVEIYLENFDLEEIQSRATAKEHQEQWGIYVPKTDANAADGSIRVRKTIFADGTTVIEDCCKTNRGAEGKLEDENKVSPTRFGQFELLADQGLTKVRYTIPHETALGVKFNFEVDVFYNKDGDLVPWAKVDAEVPVGTSIPKEEINFRCDSMLRVTPEMKAANEGNIKAKVAELYEKYFRSGNKHISA